MASHEEHLAAFTDLVDEIMFDGEDAENIGSKENSKNDHENENYVSCRDNAPLLLSDEKMDTLGKSKNGNAKTFERLVMLRMLMVVGCILVVVKAVPTLCGGLSCANTAVKMCQRTKGRHRSSRVVRHRTLLIGIVFLVVAVVAFSTTFRVDLHDRVHQKMRTGPASGHGGRRRHKSLSSEASK